MGQRSALHARCSIKEESAPRGKESRYVSAAQAICFVISLQAAESWDLRHVHPQSIIDVSVVLLVLGDY